MAHLHEETLAIINECTPATLEQYDKAVIAVETGAAVGYQYSKDFKVAIASSSNPKIMYRFGINEVCPCIAGQHNQNCWHRVAADLLYVDWELTNLENKRTREAAKAGRTPVAVAAGNALDELFRETPWGRRADRLPSRIDWRDHRW